MGGKLYYLSNDNFVTQNKKFHAFIFFRVNYLYKSNTKLLTSHAETFMFFSFFSKQENKLEKTNY